MIDATNAPRLNDPIERATLILSKLNDLQESANRTNHKIDAIVTDTHATKLEVGTVKVDGRLSRWLAIAALILANVALAIALAALFISAAGR